MTAAPGWSAAGQTELTLARAVVLFRVAGLAELAIVAAQDAPGYHGHGAMVMALLTTAIAAESAVLCTACLRARRVRPWWAVADLAFTVAVLAASAMASARYGGLYSAYPYSVICSLAFGVGLRRLSSVLAATALLAVGYLYGGGYLHAYPAAYMTVNTITYFPNTVVAWAVSRQLRRMGRELEAGRSREAMLARDQERLRHARMLHDRVLQTMETLAGGQWIADAALRARVAEESAWLRGLVEGASTAEGDLLDQLGGLVARAARDGLHVEFNRTTLRGPAVLAALDCHQGAALVGAVSEALTNVVKHAATASAVLRLTATPAALVVTVVDQGRGFDPMTQPEGMGLKESIRGRIAESGGTVRIDTAPGAGTCLEITMPRPSSHPLLVQGSRAALATLVMSSRLTQGWAWDNRAMTRSGATEPRRSFDGVAEVYHEIRPGYPAPMFEHLFRLLPAHPAILEVGPGTGQATAGLLSRGAAVHAIEIGPAMAARLREALPSPALAVTVGDFEEADVGEHAFDAVFSATAYHWISPRAQASRPVSVLKPGGVIAIVDLIQVSSPDDKGFFAAAQPVYERYGQGHAGPPAPERGAVDPPIQRVLRGDPRFLDVEVRAYDWDQAYSAAGYRKLMLSYSTTQMMTPEARQGLLDDMEDFVLEHFGNQVTRPIVVTLTTATVA